MGKRQMAKGNWRNWAELFCKCGKRYYKKYAKKTKGKYLCECGKELLERSNIIDKNCLVCKGKKINDVQEWEIMSLCSFHYIQWLSIPEYK